MINFVGFENDNVEMWKAQHDKALKVGAVGIVGAFTGVIFSEQIPESTHMLLAVVDSAVILGSGLVAAVRNRQLHRNS